MIGFGCLGGVFVGGGIGFSTRGGVGLVLTVGWLTGFSVKVGDKTGVGVVFISGVDSTFNTGATSTVGSGMALFGIETGESAIV